MSRCVPFPPPGFMWNGARDEALLDLIKVRRENTAAEKRRNKEDKRRKKKENEELEDGEIMERKCSSRHRHMHEKSNKGNEELEE
ncbi:hypothetical protein Q3G72_004580 [Acer saccharum]|nr:hypothetical protein Q3G72_004580 [Acer saccharum]